MARKFEPRVKLCGTSVTAKYITVNCTVVATVECDGVTYENCRLSRLTYNKLLKGEIVEGKMLRLAPFTDTFGITHADAYSFHSTQPRKYRESYGRDKT